MMAERDRAELEQSADEMRREQGDCRATRAAELGRVRESCEEQQRALRASCAAERADVRRAAVKCLADADARHQELLRAYWQDRESKRRTAKRNRRPIEAIQESDDEVRFNVAGFDPSLLPVWDRMRGSFSGNPHHRFEQFLEWCEENESDAAAIQLAAGEVDEADLARAQAEELAEQGDEEAIAYLAELERPRPRPRRR